MAVQYAGHRYLLWDLLFSCHPCLINMLTRFSAALIGHSLLRATSCTQGICRESIRVISNLLAVLTRAGLPGLIQIYSPRRRPDAQTMLWIRLPFADLYLPFRVGGEIIQRCIVLVYAI